MQLLSNSLSGEIIGGADGPTSIYVTSSLPSWLSGWGLVILLCLLAPTFVYALWRRKSGVAIPRGRGHASKGAVACDQVGRYVSLLLLVFRFGSLRTHLNEVKWAVPYFVAVLCMLAAYWVLWVFFARRPSHKTALALCLLLATLFLLTGAVRLQMSLVLSALLFGAGHVCVILRETRSRT